MTKLGDYKQDEFTPEELAALGEDGKGEGAAGADDKGAGKSPEEIAAEQAQAETEAKAKADAEAAKGKADDSKTDDKTKASELTAEEQTALTEEGFKLVKDEKTGKQYLVDDAGEKIPVDRWRKIYARSKQADESQRTAEETKRKLDLFKQLGPDGYYKLYPDEKPADHKPVSKQTQSEAALVQELLNAELSDGEYAGMILRDVFKEDPGYATAVLTAHMEKARGEISQAEREAAENRQKDLAELEMFCANRFIELYGRKENYTEEEVKNVEKIVLTITDWAKKNGKLLYSLEDAYLLMNKDKIFEAERRKAAEAALKGVTKTPVVSIGAGDGGGGKLSGFESYLSMSEETLAAAIDKMSEKEAAAFCKNAPKELRDKYPSLPWD